MQLEINGETRNVSSVTTVAELVEALQLPPALVLIEHNGDALHRGEWAQRVLREGDRLEILRVTAGG